MWTRTEFLKVLAGIGIFPALFKVGGETEGEPEFKFDRGESFDLDLTEENPKISLHEEQEVKRVHLSIPDNCDGVYYDEEQASYIPLHVKQMNLSQPTVQYSSAMAGTWREVYPVGAKSIYVSAETTVKNARSIMSGGIFATAGQLNIRMKGAPVRIHAVNVRLLSRRIEHSIDETTKVILEFEGKSPKRFDDG